jgi:hypothetical protein
MCQQTHPMQKAHSSEKGPKSRSLKKHITKKKKKTETMHLE